MRAKVSGAIAISQASWGCAPALPNRIQMVFLEAVQNVSCETLHQNCMTASNEPQATKSFSVQQFFKNAAEVWASSPHLRSKLYSQQVIPAAIAFLKAVQFKQS